MLRYTTRLAELVTTRRHHVFEPERGELRLDLPRGPVPDESSAVDFSAVCLVPGPAPLVAERPGHSVLADESQEVVSAVGVAWATARRCGSRVASRTLPRSRRRAGRCKAVCGLPRASPDGLVDADLGEPHTYPPSRPEAQKNALSFSATPRSFPGFGCRSTQPFQTVRLPFVASRHLYAHLDRVAVAARTAR
jgi:hypothetical protein